MKFKKLEIKNRNYNIYCKIYKNLITTKEKN